MINDIMRNQQMNQERSHHGDEPERTTKHKRRYRADRDDSYRSRTNENAVEPVRPMGDGALGAETAAISGPSTTTGAGCPLSSLTRLVGLLPFTSKSNAVLPAGC